MKETCPVANYCKLQMELKKEPIVYECDFLSPQEICVAGVVFDIGKHKFSRLEERNKH